MNEQVHSTILPNRQFDGLCATVSEVTSGVTSYRLVLGLDDCWSELVYDGSNLSQAALHSRQSLISQVVVPEKKNSVIR